MLTSEINADSNSLQKIIFCVMSKYYFQSVQVKQHQYASMDQDAWTCHTSNIWFGGLGHCAHFSSFHVTSRMPGFNVVQSSSRLPASESWNLARTAALRSAGNTYVMLVMSVFPTFSPNHKCCQIRS